MPALSLSLSKPFKNVLLSRRIQNFFKRELFRVSVGLNFVWSLSTHHTRNAKEKRQREREISSLFESEEEGVFWRSSKERQNKRHAALAVLFCSLFSLVDGAFSGREGEKKRERERDFSFITC
jgi:hypothetical protein